MAVGVRFVLEDDGDRVQAAEIRGVAVVVRGAAISDRASLEKLADPVALEAGLLAALADDQALRLSVEAAVRPDPRAVGDVVPGFDSQELSGGLYRDLHLGAAVDRDHAAYHDLPGLFADLFTEHRSLLLSNPVPTTILGLVSRRGPGAALQPL